MKQRLVGVMVLISLGVIFLPSLFSRQGDGRVEVDTQSLIPPKPDVRTIVIAPPQPTIQIPAPSPNDAFQPSIDASGDIEVSDDKIDTIEKPKIAKSSTSKNTSSNSSQVNYTAKNSPTKVTPTLDKNGLPESWVIQVASFQSKVHADTLNKKLLKKDYKSYVRPVKTAKGEFFRVFVGPYIDRSRTDKVKKNIDQTYRVSSQILRFSNK